MRLSGQDVASATMLSLAGYASYVASTNLVAQISDAGAASLGGMWSVAATVFVLRDTRDRTVAAGVSRLWATAISIALCFAYLLLFPFSPIGLAVLLGVGALIVTALGRREDIVTTGITTAVVMVVAGMSPERAWEQPLLRGLDTVVGVAIGVAFRWLMDHTLQPIGRMADMRRETDSMGEVLVPADRLWGAQTQRSLEHFSIGSDLMPREMIEAYAILKLAAAQANHDAGRLDEARFRLIVQVCDEIRGGEHHDMFPLHVWMTGSGTQFNMNVNEVISNRCCQLAGTSLGSKQPVHPNDHVNMAQSSNDSFPSAMHIAAGINVSKRLVPAVQALRDAFDARATEWKDVV
jgi:hypothetical protein